MVLLFLPAPSHTFLAPPLHWRLQSWRLQKELTDFFFFFWYISFLPDQQANLNHLATARPLCMMQEITRSAGNLELDWIKDNQKTDHLSSISIFTLQPLGNRPSLQHMGLCETINVTTQNKSCRVASIRARDQHQSRVSAHTCAAHSSHLVCISHALPPAAVPPGAQHQPDNALEGTWDTSTSYFCFSCGGKKK